MSPQLKDWVEVAQGIATIVAAVFAVIQIRIAAQQLRQAAEDHRVAAEQTRLAAEQTKTAMQGYSAETLSSLAAASRDLQWRVLQDVSLHPVLVPGTPSTGLSANQKQDVVRAMLISHYSFIFEFRGLGLINEIIWKPLQADMHGFFNSEEGQKRWGKIQTLYSPAFRSFVNKELLGQP